MATNRLEKDSMGEIKVPEDAYYGAQTQRAVENFPISSLRFSRRFIESMGEIKRSAAEVNGERGYVDAKIAKAIATAAGEVAEGKWDSQFVLDIFQTGSGTSTNMNANEVVANRAAEILGFERGSKKVHPNDHVNRGQSSNDVIPSAMHISLLRALTIDLIPSLEKLGKALDVKAKGWDKIVKVGRTHLQDATPVRLGQVFSGYATQVHQSVERLQRILEPLGELALGGTAVGTGINCPEGFAKEVISRIAKHFKLSLREAKNHFAAQGSKDAFVEASGAMRTTAVALMKLANDIRWLGSGPRCGIGEIRLPETQPGSSIMPGKVNPVIAESLIMVCAHVVGNDAAVVIGGQWGNFELNVMMPVMAHNALESAELLAKASDNFRARCVEGLEADEERCKEMIEKSLAMCTSLAPKIGYDPAAAIAKEAHKTGKTVREVAKAKKVLSDAELDRVLDPYRMTEPG
ncbi:MAG TPA: class II fumarate hydratase [Bdellovibrionota bacterium]|nr:class II fumarate hydratase [Bdellovibrionota bacterium]